MNTPRWSTWMKPIAQLGRKARKLSGRRKKVGLPKSRHPQLEQLEQRQLLSISGTVFEDLNRDGLMAGEQGLENWTVELQRIGNYGGLQQAYQNPSQENSSFGNAVAAYGDNVLVAAPDGDPGVVHLFDSATGQLLWTFEDPEPGGSFGAAMAVSGDWIFIADPYEDVNSLADAGVVYAFDGLSESPADTFEKPSPTAGDEFGSGLATLDGAIAAFAPGDDTAGANAGAVYVLDTDDGDLVKTLVNPEPSDGSFGYSLAADGDHVLVGAPARELNGSFNSGVACLFDVTATGAAPEETFSNPNTDYSWFGESLALTGGNILIGAPAENAGGPTTGAAYLFHIGEDVSNYTRLDLHLVESDPYDGLFAASVERFGDDFAISGRLQVDQGSAYPTQLYRFDGSTGALEETITYPDSCIAHENSPFAQVGDNVVVGESSASMGIYSSVGIAYLLSPSEGILREFRNPSMAIQDHFGRGVAVVGDDILVGVPNSDFLGILEDCGVVYRLSSTTGEVLDVIENPSLVANEEFGYSILALSETQFLVSAPGHDGTEVNEGIVYLYDIETGGPLWSISNPTPQFHEEFGTTLAVLDDYILVGAPYSRVDGVSGAGAVHVFDIADGEYVTTIVNPQPDSQDYFGWSLEGIGNDIVVGVPHDDTAATDAGLAYRYAYDEGSGTWEVAQPTVYQKLLPSSHDNFGASLASTDEGIVIGAYGDSTIGASTGAAYLFDADTGTWLRSFHPLGPNLGLALGYNSIAVQDNKVLLSSGLGLAYLFDVPTGMLLRTFGDAESAELQLHFGMSADAAESCIVLGSPYQDAPSEDTGAVYVYEIGATTTTDANGHYVFADLEPGTYYARLLIPDNRTDHASTFPNADGRHVVAIAEGQELELNFGSAEKRMFSEGLPYRFDFGTATSPVADDHTRVTPDDTYDVTSGYGWSVSSTVTADDEGSAWNDFTRDYHSIQTPSTDITFTADVDNGGYWVNVTLGNADEAATTTEVAIEGTDFDDVILDAGEFRTIAYPVTVSDETIDVTLGGAGAQIHAMEISTRDTTAPQVIAAEWLGPAPGLLDRVRLTFDESIGIRSGQGEEVEEEAFATEAVALVDPNEQPITNYAIVKRSATEYDILFPSQEANGTFTVTLGRTYPVGSETFEIVDLEGNMMDSDYSNTITLSEADTVGPRIVAADFRGGTGSVDTVVVLFDEPIDESSFTTSDVQISDGVSTIAATSVTKVDNQRYEIQFPSQDKAGEYSVSIGPQITDMAGLQMDQNQNGTQGESSDAFEATFTLTIHEELKFDFGEETSPLEDGYERITSDNTDTLSWVEPGVAQVDQEGATGLNLERDFVYVPSGSMTCDVNVSNGVYDVTLTIGDHDNAKLGVGVVLEGTEMATVSTSSAGEYATNSTPYRVVVEDGTLTLSLVPRETDGNGELIVDGELDPAFGDQGVVVTDLARGEGVTVTATTVQADEKILVVGSDGDDLPYCATMLTERWMRRSAPTARSRPILDPSRRRPPIVRPPSLSTAEGFTLLGRATEILRSCVTRTTDARTRPLTAAWPHWTSDRLSTRPTPRPFKRAGNSLSLAPAASISPSRVLRRAEQWIRPSVQATTARLLSTSGRSLAPQRP